MSALNLNHFASTFRNYAASFTAPNGKAIGGKEPYSTTSAPAVRFRDEFILSTQGRAAYERFVNKVDKTEQSLVTTQAVQVAEVPRIFSTAPESVDSLIQFLGLDTINGSDAPLAGALNLSLESEVKAFSDKLTSLLQEVGVEINDETDLEITFVADTEGNIVIESGNLTDEQKTKLAELINDNPEMVEQIKNLSAKLQVADALENDIDLSSDSLAWARNQLLSNFLRREGGFSLNDVAFRIDPETGVKSLFQQDKNGNEVKDSLLPTLLANMPGLEEELLRSLESLGQPALPSGNTVPLLKMSNGTVSRGSKEVVQENNEPHATVNSEEAFVKLEEGQAIQERIRLMIEDFHQKELQRQEKAGFGEHSFFEDVYKKSKHFDTLAWALGLEMDNSWDDRWNPYGNPEYLINDSPAPQWTPIRSAVSRSVQTKTNVELLRAKNQANWEKIDKKITDILKSNGIVLGKEDTLTFKVNQRGEITVGNGVNKGNEGTRKTIEKLLNDDKTLSQDLLYTHAERRWAVMGAGDVSWHQERDYDGRGNVERYILTDMVLQREYGVSLNDIQMSGGVHADLLEKLYNEERMFYNDIEGALKSLEENDGDFEVKFAYKNGITIESGITDQAAMNTLAEQQLFTSYNWHPGLGVKTSVALDPTGMILNAQVTDIGGTLSHVYVSEDHAFIFNHLNKQLTTHLEWGEKYANTYNQHNDTGPTPTQSRLQQYVFDSQRLFQFNTGADSATAKAMNVTYSTTGAFGW